MVVEVLGVKAAAQLSVGTEASLGAAPLPIARTLAVITSAVPTSELPPAPHVARIPRYEVFEVLLRTTSSVPSRRTLTKLPTPPLLRQTIPPRTPVVRLGGLETVLEPPTLFRGLALAAVIGSTAPLLPQEL